MTISDRITRFLELAQQAIAIRDSEASWETKYELIFSEEISVAIRNSGIIVDYYDPDTSYEEDAKAFVDAIQEKATELQKVIALRP